jgi:ATP-independent RNA helicase DbpA
MSSFDPLSLSPKLKSVLSELGYQKPTPIQEQSLPLLLQGKDLIGQSSTGSGKTAAFTLPILERFDREIPDLQRNPILKALILCPTRELCVQVMGEIRKLGKKHMGLKVLTLTGGQEFGPQAVALEKGIHIVVGTPGRICDHLRRGTLQVDSINTLVLDEADRMLEMGFAEEMDFIFERIPKKRHTLLFSATFPENIDNLSKKIQSDPVTITIQKEPENRPNIEQWAHVIPKTDGQTVDFSDRLKLVFHVLNEHQPESGIIFVNFKTDASALLRELSPFQISAGALYGDLEQQERDQVMVKFRNQSLRILIATDVAARGLDIDSVDLVINFDLPQNPEVYVHRIGRTGRAGRSGRAVSIVHSKQTEKLDLLETLTNSKISRIEPLDLKSMSLSDLGKNLKLDSSMTTLFISAGRKNKIRPADILGALTGDAGRIEGSKIGKIEIQDYFSFVAVHHTVAKHALRSLQEGRIKGRRVRAELAR